MDAIDIYNCILVFFVSVIGFRFELQMTLTTAVPHIPETRQVVLNPISSFARLGRITEANSGLLLTKAP